jgi:hypothetical protein
MEVRATVEEERPSLDVRNEALFPILSINVSEVFHVQTESGRSTYSIHPVQKTEWPPIHDVRFLGFHFGQEEQ